MGALYNQILNILTTPPGNLTYHLVLAFAAAGALQSALSNWRQSDFPQGQRMVVGLSLLLGIRVILFLGAGFVWQGITPPESIIPIFDRTVTMLGIILIVWLWCFPEPLQLADWGGLLLGFLTLTLAMFNYLWVTTQTSLGFYNNTWFNILWEISALLVLLVGSGLVLRRQPNEWIYGIVMLGIMTGGHFLHLVLPGAESDLPGAVRLAQIAAYPLLFFLPQRFRAKKQVEEPETSEETAPLIHKRRRYKIEPHILEEIFKISPELTKAEIQEAVTRLSSQIMLADLSLLISLPDSQGEINILTGYDLIREESLGGNAISSKQLPLLSTALRREQTLRLPASSTSQDLLNLSKLLRLGRAGHLLAAPLILEKQEEKYGLILLSPYSSRSWTKEDQVYLRNLIKAIQNALSRESETPDLRKKLKQTQQVYQSAQRELEETRGYSQALQQKITSMQKEAEAIEENAQELEKLRTSLENARETIANLEIEKIELEDQIKKVGERSFPAPDQQLKNELRLALEEIAHLKKNLEESQEQARDNGGLSEAQVKSISTLTRELRQPLSSMVGYTDILLGESVGILGSLQKQLLERIRVSSERISTLLNTVIKEAAIYIDSLSLTPTAVSLSEAIDQAIPEVREQILKKQLSLRVDLPKKLPNLLIDQDSLHQILLNLLKNATSVTIPEGEIFIRAKSYNELSEQDFGLIQVADQGGGIPKDELPRVFSQLYNKAKIRGIEDQGTGLSIVKALVEAQQGRVWVDSKEGVGATFSLLIPLATGAEEHE